MYDNKITDEDDIDEDEICVTHSCNDCPLYQKCYNTYDEVTDDYETMLPDEFIDKYVK